jgi:hypothetical protein
MLLRLTLIAAVAVLSAAPASATASTGAARPAGSTDARHQLLGDWRFEGGGSYRFSERRGRVDGRSRRALRLGGCRIAKNAVVFKGYRFLRRRGRADVWRGRVAFVRRGCRRVLVESTIVVESDLRFTETSVLEGERQRPGTFRRIKPPVRAKDPAVGTWVRNNAGVIVTAGRGGYEGRARESYLIANGCTVPAGTLVWRLEPVAPERYRGSVQTFLGPRANCRPGSPARSRWRLDETGRLVRESADGDSFPYERSS